MRLKGYDYSSEGLYFSHVTVANYVVMPNHVHLILVLNYTGNYADNDGMIFSGIGFGVGPCHGVAPPSAISPPSNQFGKPIPGSVSVIINQYKATMKRWCNQHGKEYFLVFGLS